MLGGPSPSGDLRPLGTSGRAPLPLGQWGLSKMFALVFPGRLTLHRKQNAPPRSNLRSGHALRVFLDETCSRSHQESQGHAQLVGDSRAPLGAGLSCLLICPFHSPAPSRPPLPPATRSPAHPPTRPHLQPGALHVPAPPQLPGGRCLRRLQEARPPLFPRVRTYRRGSGTTA